MRLRGWKRMGAIIAAAALLTGCRLIDDPTPQIPEDAAVESFAFHHSGMSTFDIWSYTVETDEATGEMTVNCDLYCGAHTHSLPADEEFLQELTALIADHDLRAWNGFDKTDKRVLDGSGFDLNIGFAGGATITASGSNRFPDGYAGADDAIEALFLGYLEKHGIDVTWDDG